MRWFVVLVVVMALFGWGCAGDGESSAPTSPAPATLTTLPPIADATTTTAAAPTTLAPATTTPPTTTTTTLDPLGEPYVIYLLGDTTTGESGPFLVPVSRRSEGEEQIDAERAIRSLLAGLRVPEGEAGLSTAIPAGSTLLGFTVEDTVAVIDLNSEFEDGGPGGSFSAMAKLAQLTWTATRDPAVSAVGLLINGEPVDHFSSEGLELPDQITRADFAILRPAILVDEPAWGSEVGLPFDVQGVASVFEATVQWELRGREGAVLSTGFFTALDAMPAWAAFGGEIPADLSGLESDTAQPFDGTLVVWEDGAETGGRLWEMVYPLSFAELR